MGNDLAIHSRATCYKCNETLITSVQRWARIFWHRTLEYHYGRRTLVFYQGRFFRFVDRPGEYQCPQCFWKPRNDEIRRKKEEEERERQEQEERERQEEEQIKQQEEERRKREEEERRKQQEEKERKHRSEQLRAALNTFVSKDRERNIASHEQQGGGKTLQTYHPIDYDSSDTEDLLRWEDVDEEQSDELPLDFTAEEPLTKATVSSLLQNIATAEVKCKLSEMAFSQWSKLLPIFLDLLDDWFTVGLMPKGRAIEWMLEYVLVLFTQLATDGNDPPEFTMNNIIEFFHSIKASIQTKEDLLEFTNALFHCVNQLTISRTSPLFHVIKMYINRELEDFHEHTLKFLTGVISNEKMFDPLFERSVHSSNWAKTAGLLLVKLCIPCTRSSMQSSLCSLIQNNIWNPVDILECLTAVQYWPPDIDTCSRLANILELILSYRIEINKNISGEETVLDLLCDGRVDEMIPLLEKVYKDEENKNTESILSEMKLNHWACEDDLTRVKAIMAAVEVGLEDSGYPHQVIVSETDAEKKSWREKLPQDQTLKVLTDTQLSDSLIVLSCAVKSNKGYWPRKTQMISWLMLLLARKEMGRLIEIATGEGKSCIIAMAAAMMGCFGCSVDIVTSSPTLADRDWKEWQDFYGLFDLQSNQNCNKTSQDEKQGCYATDIVYGTVSSFAADILKQEFEKENVRGKRKFDCVIVDEVDFMMLDQGVQFTYLSHTCAGLRHLEPLLAMTWNYVSSFKPYINHDGLKLYAENPKPFHLALTGILDKSVCEEPHQILLLAENEELVEKGFTEKYEMSTEEEKSYYLDNISKSDMVQFFKKTSEYFLPYIFQPHVLNEETGMIETTGEDSLDPDIAEAVIPVLLHDKGRCSVLHDDEQLLKYRIIDMVRSKLPNEFDDATSQEDSDVSVDNVHESDLQDQCNGEKTVDKTLQEARKDQESQQNRDSSEKLELPKYLQFLAYDRIPSWVENAFIATRIQEGREYLVKNNEVIPVDYRSTGMIEVNKRWGGGLQQFVEMKHRLPVSQLSLVTNFMSNVALFKRYQGNIFGVTGTLGSFSDHEFLRKYFCVDLTIIPTHKTRKLYEEEGEIILDEEKWMHRICEKVQSEVNVDHGGRKGRAALVICEDIKTAQKVSEAIKGQKNGNVSLFIRSDNKTQMELQEEYGPGDVIVATNLAGRGTDFKVSKQVNDCGGLYVLVTFLPTNTRVENQAFGRTGRKGSPGSAQIILNRSKLHNVFLNASTMQQLKNVRDRREQERIEFLEKTEFAECALKEELFSKYRCSLDKTYIDLKGINELTERDMVMQSLHEYWGIWLLMQAEAIEAIALENGDSTALMKQLDEEMAKAQDAVSKKESPSSNFYTVIKFANELMFKDKYADACSLYDRAISMDEVWATIAYYNHAYCTLKGSNSDYTQVLKNLKKSSDTITKYQTEVLVTSGLVKQSGTCVDDSKEFDVIMETRLKVLGLLEDNINQTIETLQDIIEKGKEAEISNEKTLFSMISDADQTTNQELAEMWQLGLPVIYSVKEKPKFCWGGLAVCLLGVLQVAAGVAITTLSFGAATSFGMDRIVDGVSDMWTGIQSMWRGEFSLKNWAINKAISLVTSIIAFGVTKMAKYAYKVGKSGVIKAAQGISKLTTGSLKNVGHMITENVGYITKKGTEMMKALPGMLPNLANREMGTVLKENLRNAGIKVVKEFAKEGVMTIVNYGQDKIIERLFQGLSKEIRKKVKKSLQKNTQNLKNITQRMIAYNMTQPEVINTYKTLAKEISGQFHGNPGLLEYFSNGVKEVISKARGKLEGDEAVRVLKLIDGIHTASTVSYAIAKLSDIIERFEEQVCNKVSEFCEEQHMPTGEGITDPGEIEAVTSDVIDCLAEILSNAMTQIIQTQVASKYIQKARGMVNKCVGSVLDKHVLHTRYTDEKLHAGAAARCLEKGQIKETHMSDLESHKTVEAFVERLQNGDPASLLNAKIIGHTEGVNVRIVGESNGKIVDRAHIPGPEGNNKTVTLVHRPRSEEYPTGHYEVLHDGKCIPVENKGNDCLYHALAIGLHPDAPEHLIKEEATKLKDQERNEITTHPGKWVEFIERDNAARKLQSGPDFLLLGAGGKKVLDKNSPSKDVQQELNEAMVGDVTTSSKGKQINRTQPPSTLKVELDHQPPVSVLKGLPDDNRLKKPLINQNLMKHHGDTSEHGNKLPTNRLLAPHHRACPTTGNSYMARDVRDKISESAKNENVVEFFKRTFISTSPTFIREVHQMKHGNTDALPDCIKDTQLADAIEGKGYKEMAGAWYKILGAGQNPVMTQTHHKELIDWIENDGYKNPNDPEFKNMSDVCVGAQKAISNKKQSYRYCPKTTKYS